MSAQGNAAPPILDAIMADTKIGIIDILKCIANSIQMKANNKITVKLFINSDKK